MRSIRGIHRFHLLFLLAAAAVATLVVNGPARPANADDSAMPMVKNVVDQALKLLVDKQTPLRQRQEALRNLVSSHFDFTRMSRSALGYHWRDLGADQRKDFTQAFTAFIQDSYLSKMQDYSGQKVVFGRETRPDPGYAQVTSQVIQPEGKQPVAVNYMVVNTGGEWKIYDVTVDNISIIANYRNQFNRVINQKGFDTLLADLRSKQEKLAAELGTPHAHE